MIGIGIGEALSVQELSMNVRSLALSITALSSAHTSTAAAQSVSDDLIERLNRGEGIGACLAGDSWFAEKVMKDAAMEIERLRAEVALWKDRMEAVKIFGGQ
jgi:hypothetical protein